MRRLSFLAILVSAPLMLHCAAPPAPPLTADDFTLRGVPFEADSTELRLTFGAPDSIMTSDNPFDDTPLVTWLYGGFEVRFGSGAFPSGFLIHERGEATLRGLQVGDPAQVALRLYGEPTTRIEPSWTWAVTSEEMGLQVVNAEIQSDTVRRIYVGRAID